MQSFNVAHLNIQNVNIVIVFLNQAFDRKTDQEQHQTQSALQFASQQVGWNGNVVPVWTDAFGRTKFIAPPQQRSFFQSATYHELYSQVNKTLDIG